MATHDKVSFVREYCRCRRIPYQIRFNEQLYIDGRYVCYSVHNLTYKELIDVIDEICCYDDLTTFYVNRRR